MVVVVVWLMMRVCCVCVCFSRVFPHQSAIWWAQTSGSERRGVGRTDQTSKSGPGVIIVVQNLRS